MNNHPKYDMYISDAQNFIENASKLRLAKLIKEMRIELGYLNEQDEYACLKQCKEDVDSCWDLFSCTYQELSESGEMQSIIFGRVKNMIESDIINSPWFKASRKPDSQLNSIDDAAKLVAEVAEDAGWNVEEILKIVEARAYKILGELE